MHNLNKIQDFDYNGKRVFLRVDFNVPFNPDGSIADTTRIQSALPTIQYLLDKNAKLLIVSHLGRPKGSLNPKLSLQPIASSLTKLLGRHVPLVQLDDNTHSLINDMRPGSAAILENIRFHPGEEANDTQFSKTLASLADTYVNDAFGTAHRAHASTVGLPKLLPNPAAGFLIQKEIQFLHDHVNNPQKPFTVILGGAKVSDKINIINKLLEKANTMLIGGAMAYTFKLALGHSVGSSLVEPDKLQVAKNALQKAKELGVELLLPLDNTICDALDFQNRSLGNTKIISQDIPNSWEGVDIGPKTIDLYKKIIAKSQTILWNGPMGICEIPNSSLGTNSIADAVAHSPATTIVGGGDSIQALIASGFASSISFISTGGGASLQFLEGATLPGIHVLTKK